MPKRTFERRFEILTSGGSVCRKKGSGRPRKFSGLDRRRFAFLQFLEWPLNSLHLNPVEKVWQLKDYVEKKNPRTVEELRGYTHESQLASTQEIQVRLMETISRRLEGCLPTGNIFMDN